MYVCMYVCMFVCMHILKSAHAKIGMRRKCVPYFASSAATPIRYFGACMNTLCGGCELADAFSGVNLIQETSWKRQC